MVRCVAILFFGFSWSGIDQGPISVSESISVGGIKQWINIKGKNPNLPVLLFLHGGPGNSAMGYADKFTTELQKYFVVVQWDQRESGQTLRLNTSDKPLSVSLMESDAIEMINYLRVRFSKDKIYLMGQSWGGFLGLKVAAARPDLLECYMAVSTMVDQLASERLSLKWMLDKAAAEKNEQALNDLNKVNVPFENGEQLFYHRNWLARLGGNKFPSKEFVVTWAEKWLPLFNEASAVSFFEIAPEIKCPVYFFVGRQDYQTHFEITEKYFNSLRAPKKQLFWFDNSGHNLHVKEAAKFQEIILTEIAEENGNR
ncbi:MAG: alpha/beta hydrolase [Marivirga sp.]|nr:alpha/beta hydrolase [Marivirga sp.]